MHGGKQAFEKVVLAQAHVCPASFGPRLNAAVRLKNMDIWLVVWNMNVIFPSKIGVWIIIPTDELTHSMIFQRGRLETTNQYIINHH